MTLAPRVESDLLLVGCLPADSTESALRQWSELYGDRVLALPDGKTGPRAARVGYEREQLMKANQAFELVEATASPSDVPRHAYETRIFRLRDGAEVHWDTWTRIDDASQYELGVAMYGGFGRQPGKDGREAMRRHRETALAVRELWSVGTPA